MHYIAGRKGESEMQKWMEDRCNLDIDIIALRLVGCNIQNFPSDRR